MAIENILRPSRNIKKPARFQHGASVHDIAIAAEIDENPTHKNPTQDCHNPPTITPLLPTTQKLSKKRGRPSKIMKPNASLVAAVVPSSAVDAVILGETVPEVLETAASTVANTRLEDSDGYNSDGNPAKVKKRKAKLKTEDQMEREVKKQRKHTEQVEFTKNIESANTVEFQPFPEGPHREPQVNIPQGTDIDSPYALFSLFWSEEMWKILADNTNAYALRQGVIQRERETDLVYEHTQRRQ